MRLGRLEKTSHKITFQQVSIGVYHILIYDIVFYTHLNRQVDTNHSLYNYSMLIEMSICQVVQSFYLTQGCQVSVDILIINDFNQVVLLVMFYYFSMRVGRVTFSLFIVYYTLYVCFLCSLLVLCSL